MPADRDFADRVERLCAPLGQVWSRNMFGGFGVYCDRVMFGLIANGVLYLKVDDVNRGDFEEADLEPFVHHGATRTITMSYHRAPEGSLDDWPLMEPWARGSVKAAERTFAKRDARSSRRRRAPSSTFGSGPASR
jgi:DNA transformation protein and related proteins